MTITAATPENEMHALVRTAAYCVKAASDERREEIAHLRKMGEVRAIVESGLPEAIPWIAYSISGPRYRVCNFRRDFGQFETLADARAFLAAL